jgi:hypothetical protein
MREAVARISPRFRGVIRATTIPPYGTEAVCYRVGPGEEFDATLAYS